MTNAIRCPECGSDEAECIRKPHHNHICHTCGHSMLDPLRSVTKWLVETFDLPGAVICPPPPAKLRESIYRFIYEDNDGSLHGKELTYAEVVAWVDDEFGWAQFDHMARREVR
jgi:hypothetical protein